MPKEVDKYITKTDFKKCNAKGFTDFDVYHLWNVLVWKGESPKRATIKLLEAIK